MTVRKTALFLAFFAALASVFLVYWWIALRLIRRNHVSSPARTLPVPEQEQKFCGTADRAMNRIAEYKVRGNEIQVLATEREEIKELTSIVGKELWDWVGTVSVLRSSDNPLAGEIVVIVLACGQHSLTAGSVDFPKGLSGDGSSEVSGVGSPAGVQDLGVGDSVVFAGTPNENLWDLASNPFSSQELPDAFGAGHFPFDLGGVSKLGSSKRPQPKPPSRNDDTEIQ